MDGGSTRTVPGTTLLPVSCDVLRAADLGRWDLMGLGSGLGSAVHGVLVNSVGFLCEGKQTARRPEAVTLGTGSSQSGRKIPRIWRTGLSRRQIWREIRYVAHACPVPTLTSPWLDTPAVGVDEGLLRAAPWWHLPSRNWQVWRCGSESVGAEWYPFTSRPSAHGGVGCGNEIHT